MEPTLVVCQNTWAPVVDKIWDEWQAELKKMLKPEFVRPEDIIDDEEDAEIDKETSTDAVARAAATHEEFATDEEESPLMKYDAKARAERIKKHVTKVVQQKKKEVVSPVEMKHNVEMNIMGEIERYTQFGFLKKKILITMANTMDRSEVSNLREWFLNADTNQSGTITLDELKEAFKRVTPDAEDAKIEEIFRGIDRDRSGHIHYDEFLAALSESHGLVTMDRLSEAFDRIDRE
jgi:hypothetical protein